MFGTYAGESLEDRLLRFLCEVPLSSVERALSQVAPGCSPRDMTGAEVVRVLGVAGIASLAGVRRSTVLESAGPESCAIADLIESNPYGAYQNAGGASCWPCSQAYGPSVGGRAPAPSPWNGRGISDPGYAYGGGVEGQRTFAPSTQLERTRTAAPSAAGYAGGSVASSLTQPGPQSYGGGYGASASSPGWTPRYRQNPEAGPISGTFGPEPYTFETLPGETPGETEAPFSGWPGAVPFRRDAWNFSESWYILQSGDTFSGLASTYLGHPSRYLEIWQLQPYRYTKAIDPSSVKPDRPLVQVGERVIMPAEALERARELVTTGAPSAPAIGGVGGSPKGKGAPWSMETKVAIGVAALGALGVGAYALT